MNTQTCNPYLEKDAQTEFSNLIRQMETRPGMYLGGNSLTALRHFLDGYKMAKFQFSIQRHGNLFPLDFWFMNEFTTRLRPDFTSCMGWHNHILSLCDGDDAEALRLFFDLYHEFEQVRMKYCHKSILSEANIQWNDSMAHAYRLSDPLDWEKKEPLFQSPVATYVLELTIPNYLLVVENENDVRVEPQFFKSFEDAAGKAESYFGKIDRWEKFKADNLYFDKTIHSITSL